MQRWGSIQKSCCAQDGGESADVDFAKAGDLVTVRVEDADALTVPINRNHDLGAVARIASDVVASERRDIFDQPDVLLKKRLPTDAVETDWRAGWAIAAGGEQHGAFALRPQQWGVGIDEIETNPTEPSR